MAFALVVTKAIIEVAAMALLAQFIVGMFAWGRRNQNVIYTTLRVVASPFTRLVRLVTPKVVLDQHIPLATFLLLVFAWGATIYGIHASCTHDPRQQACARLER